MVDLVESAPPASPLDSDLPLAPLPSCKVLPPYKWRATTAWQPLESKLWSSSRRAKRGHASSEKRMHCRSLQGHPSRARATARLSPVVMQKQVPAVQTVQKTGEIPQAQCIDRPVDIPVVHQRQILIDMPFAMQHQGAWFRWYRSCSSSTRLLVPPLWHRGRLPRFRRSRKRLRVHRSSTRLWMCQLRWCRRSRRPWIFHWCNPGQACRHTRRGSTPGAHDPEDAENGRSSK